jgi:hypothetical protein
LPTGPERDARFGSILPIGLPLANGRHLRGVDGRCRRFSRLLLPELRRRGHSLISLLAAGDPALAKLENRLAAKPKIVVPAVTLDGVDDPLKPDGRHVAPFPSDLVTGDDGLMSGLRPICRDCLHCEGGRRCSWHLSLGSVRHPCVHRLGGPGPCHRDRRRWLKTTRAAFTWPQSPSEFIWTCCLAPGKHDPHREAPTSPQSPTQWHFESRRREGASLTTSAKQLSV